MALTLSFHTWVGVSYLSLAGPTVAQVEVFSVNCREPLFCFKVFNLIICFSVMMYCIS